MLQTILIATQALFLLVIGFLVGYLCLLSLLAAYVRQSRKIAPTSGRRFAVLIPAHNEEFAIAPTIQSCLQLDYPRDRFDVLVIADNCTDRTAKISRENGADVLERMNNELRGKGHALRWCIDRLLLQSKPYDAFVIVDADSTVSQNFLGIMNSSLEQGAKVIQSSDLVKPQPGAWSSEMTRLGFVLYNYARPLGRSILGCSAGLRGNGMCFAAEVLRSNPWNAYSRTEDLEFGLHLLLQDIPVSFVREAGVLATMPQNPRLAESQRARWEGGRLSIIRKYAGRLLNRGLFHGSFACIDALIDLVTPALVNLMAMVIGILIMTIVLLVAGVDSMDIFVYLWISVFVLGLLHVFIGLYAARADASLYKALLYLPRYAAWKALLYFKLAQREETTEWIRTTREQGVVPEDSTKV